MQSSSFHTLIELCITTTYPELLELPDICNYNMASYGTVHRPSTNSASASAVQAGESRGSDGKNCNDDVRVELKLVCPFRVPSSADAAALRIIRNLGRFAIYYTHFVWIILFISLIPKRKVSLIFFVIMTYVGSLYLLLLRALPNSNLLHKVIDKGLVLGLLAFVTIAGLILTHAAIHLLVTLAAAIPIVLLHAVLWVTEDLYNVNYEETNSTGDLAPLVQDSRDMV